MSNRNYQKMITNHQRDDEEDEFEFPGYPLYPKNKDIYNKSKEEQGIDPEDILHQKEAKKINQYKHNNDHNSEETVDDLDVPGAELGDDEENLGNEDEENNYYSLGGDNHNDLEEDKGNEL